MNTEISKSYVLTGVVLPFGMRTRNNYVYTPESIPAEVLEKFRDRVYKGEVVGVLEPSSLLGDGLSTPLEQVSHKVIDLNLTDNGIEADLEILDTPKGKLVKEILDAGITLWGASRSLGKVENDGQIKMDQFLSIDLTTRPTFNLDAMSPLKLRDQSRDTEEEIAVEEKPSCFTFEQWREISNIVNSKIKTLSEDIQMWVEGEFADNLQKWLVQEFVSSLKIEVDKNKLKS